MRRHEVLQNVQSFTEIGLDRKLDRMSGRIGHQASHTGQLLDLLIGTTGSGIRHHEDVIVLIQSLQQLRGQDLVSLLPGLDDFLITLLFCEESSAVVPCDLVDGVLRFLDELRLFRRNCHVGNGNRHGCDRRILIPHRLDRVEHFCRHCRAVDIDRLREDRLQLLLACQEINFQLECIFRILAVYEPEILRDDLVEQETSQCTGNIAGDRLAVLERLLHTDRDPGLQRNVLVFIGKDRLIQACKMHSLALHARTLLRQVINTEDHILGRNRDRTAVGRLEQVVR